MARTISARDANQRFSELLAHAAGGETVVITRRGKPVAQLVPYDAATVAEDRLKAWDRLIALFERGIPLGGERFERDSLYDRCQ
jgi:prevent-host-death family protein